MEDNVFPLLLPTPFLFLTFHNDQKGRKPAYLLLKEQPVSCFNVWGHEAIFHPGPTEEAQQPTSQTVNAARLTGLKHCHLQGPVGLTLQQSALGHRPSPVEWLFSGDVETLCPGRLPEARWPALKQEMQEQWVVKV